jgi:metallo-beta-lactamase class B
MPWAPREAAVRALWAPFPVEAWKAEPFKVFDNVYHVGPQVASAFLVVGGNELALIDAGYAETADGILENIRKVGHDPAQLKYIIVTHAHFDHFGGVGRIKQVATKARVVLSEADWNGLAQAQGAPRGRQNPGLPVARDLVVRDGDELRVGNDSLKVFVTPGHTPGSLAIEVPVRQNGRTYRALVPCTGINASPDLTMPFIASMERLKRMGPWDTLLPPHPFLMPSDTDLLGPAALIFDGYPPNQSRAPRGALLGSARINTFFDDILKVANQKLASEQGGAARGRGAGAGN